MFEETSEYYNELINGPFNTPEIIANEYPIEVSSCPLKALETLPDGGDALPLWLLQNVCQCSSLCAAGPVPENVTQH